MVHGWKTLLACPAGGMLAGRVFGIRTMIDYCGRRKATPSPSLPEINMLCT